MNTDRPTTIPFAAKNIPFTAQPITGGQPPRPESTIMGIRYSALLITCLLCLPPALVLEDQVHLDGMPLLVLVSVMFWAFLQGVVWVQDRKNH